MATRDRKIDAFYYRHWGNTHNTYVLLDKAVNILREAIGASRLLDICNGARCSIDEHKAFRKAFEMPVYEGAEWVKPTPSFVQDRIAEFVRVLREQRPDILDELKTISLVVPVGEMTQDKPIEKPEWTAGENAAPIAGESSKEEKKETASKRRK